MVRRIPSELPALRLLRSYLTTAWDEQVDAGPDVQRALVAHVYDLMAAMMGPTRDAAALAQERGVAAARLYAIKGDVARNLASSGLTVAALALRHRCTARSIQRLFEQDGTTFTEYLLAQRLARAHELLGDARRRADEDQHGRARLRFRRRLVFQSGVSPPLRGVAVGCARAGAARRRGGQPARQLGHDEPTSSTRLGCGNDTDNTHETTDAIQTIQIQV